MLALDATTRSEYDAETTAADAAQAVVDALGATVYVKVYDGAGNVKASGTMGSPWATQAAGVITIGEVSSFSITAAGAVDPTWYLRFEGGSRWVQGSFGLKDSDADFRLSSDAWINGYTIRLGTLTLSAPSDTAPSLDGAPSALSFTYGIGGTYDFSTHASDPDGGTLTYSLVGTAYTGITISTAGVLTVTTVAAAAVRDLVVRVTDPTGLFTDWPVTVTVSSLLLEELFKEYAVGTIAAAGLYRGATRYWRNHIDGNIDGTSIAGMMETSLAAVSATEQEFQTRITKTVTSLPHASYPGIDSYRSELKGTYPALFDRYFDANGRHVEMFYGWRFRITELTFAGNLVTGYCFQFHNTEGGAGQDPIFALLIAGTKTTPKIQVYQEANIETGGNRYTDLINPLVIGQWYDIVIAARWCYNTNAEGGNGRLRIWIDSDPDGTPRFDWSGGNCHPPPSTNGRIPHIKFGQYHTLFEYSGQGSVGDTVRYAARQLRVTPAGTRADVAPR